MKIFCRIKISIVFVVNVVFVIEIFFVIFLQASFKDILHQQGLGARSEL